ncbi:TonB family protein [Robiginitalea sp. M366]|uniref:energy transducer TonB n=1 Tax=Robiginitalea aestuariiviva TaxID=3036903 RepID=UPI00240D4302|nr:energy transducer TonB [Robiginitalea aestuariiviva]MDG1571006.1 TonB family protein [Robiginitalea aestuariiviva]
MKTTASSKTPSKRRVTKAEVSLPRSGVLRFQIGLILAMLISYIALEWVWPEVPPRQAPPESLEEAPVFFVMEEPPKEMAQAPRPKAPPRPKPIQVLPLEVQTPAANPPDIVPPISLPRPFSPAATPSGSDPEPAVYHVLSVQELPVFPGCEETGPEERLACFQRQLTRHIRKNFRYPESAVATGQQGRVMVEFVIDPGGVVGQLRLRGPALVLEAEAERIISGLPRMLPARVQGIPVAVRYTVPIQFVLDQ